VAGRIRVLPRYSKLTDTMALELRFPLAEAQEVIATENGYGSWAALKADVDAAASSHAPIPQPGKPTLKGATPVLFVSNMEASVAFLGDKLGFGIDFLHGKPPFYGSVSRNGARLHLRFVHEAAFIDGIVEREQLLSAFIEVDDVKSLYAEYLAAGVDMHSRLRKEPWGGPVFVVRDPDGNLICFSS
jgi:catechol 2,3-dioxygenase-like lactoylglutathione lyase family enzyme